MTHDPTSSGPDAPFAGMSDAVREWFAGRFGEPTEVQAGTWAAAARGDDVLAVAPTGSGKTLAAFLWFIDRLGTSRGDAGGDSVEARDAARAARDAARAARDTGGVRVLYVSPLKALGVDVGRNLRKPLAGLGWGDRISIGIRSGDTPQAERARLGRKPPDILITTPESLYLMLTSSVRETLRGVEAVIVDEIHAVAGSKRGSHLALSLERLDALAGRHVPRIGLSATVRPIDAVAAFLAGAGPDGQPRPCTVVAPPSAKKWDVSIRVPVDDMTALPEHPPLADGTGTGGAGARPEAGDYPEPDDRDGEATDAGAAGSHPGEPPGSMWPFIDREVYREASESTSTLVFVNSRRNAEKLTGRLNELWAADHAPELLSPARRRSPAQLGLVNDVAGQAPAMFARAHHGSVSKEERAGIEAALKDGRLRCVVATGTLELGIDMGDVDLVIQVEAPPSTAAALQRIGRAGHRVGAVSRGIVFPLHPADLLASAVVVDRMLGGDIEELRIPDNPLDVLAQQTIAATVAAPGGTDVGAGGAGGAGDAGGADDPEGNPDGGLGVDEWFGVVRGAWPYRALGRDVFDAVIDQVTGAYPTADLSDLRPRLTLDPGTGDGNGEAGDVGDTGHAGASRGPVLRPRPGALRLAVTSGGTIPDRGLFGVFLSGGEDGARRVGELDEEMVYESRVGDVITLGATSWRITAIDRDRVLVVPAQGLTGRLPFWNGDDAARPAELAAGFGKALRDPDSLGGVLDERARANLAALVDRQRESVGMVPDDRDLLVEAFRDDVGDWQVVLHSPFGRGVNAPWALAAGERARELYGVDARPVAGDDGIILRLPAMDNVPGAELFDVPVTGLATDLASWVSTTALFTARFRECAARSLLIPRWRPGTRQPLWRQRLKAEQLLTAVRGVPGFPVLLETTRECLRDVYDVPALEAVLGGVRSGRIRLHSAETASPSPFAAAQLFRYTGQFLYEGDVPAAERHAAALNLDPDLLAGLVGGIDLREVLSDAVIAGVVADLQHTSERTLARSSGELLDVLRELGPVPEGDVGKRARDGVEVPVEAVRIDLGGRPHLAHPNDAGFADADPAPLLRRWARRHGPFTVAEAAEGLGWGRGVAARVIESVAGDGVILRGWFRDRPDADGPEWCDRGVLDRLRSAARAEALAGMEPVGAAGVTAFLARWHGIGVGGVGGGVGGDGDGDGYPGEGADAFDVIERLAGVGLTMAEWDRLALPARGVAEGDLDELIDSGDAAVTLRGDDVYPVPADLTAAWPDPGPEPDDGAGAEVLAVLRRGGSWTYPDLMAECGPCRTELLDLARAGLAVPETLAGPRAMAAGAGTRPVRVSRRRVARVAVPPDVAGRWRAAPAHPSLPTANPGAGGATTDSGTAAATGTVPTDEAAALLIAEGLLERWGVATRAAAVTDGVSWAAAYRALRGMESAGRVIRGEFIAGAGPAQFAPAAVVDELRTVPADHTAHAERTATARPAAYVVAARDPANPFGAILPWPDFPGGRPTRSPGAVAVLADGHCPAWIGPGRNSMLVLPGHEEEAIEGLRALAQAEGRATVVVKRINGDDALRSALLPALKAAGGRAHPKGLSSGA